MTALAVLALFLEEPKFEPGPYAVKVKKASIYSEPNNLDPDLIIGEAKKGDIVQAQKRVYNGKVAWAQCRFTDGKSGYLPMSSIITEKEFRDQPEGSEETGARQAEGYRGSRFDPKTEDKFKNDKNLGPAYEKVDHWCGCPQVFDKKENRVVKEAMPGRPAWKNDRAAMLRVLKEFRREGKLGEFGEQH